MSTRRSRTRSEAARRGALLTLVTGLVAGGCLFSPRPAPTPCTPGQPGCKLPPVIQDRVTPEIAMDNIRNIILKQNTVPYYEDALAEDFVYIPDADADAAAANNPCGSLPFFANWDRKREVRFMQYELELATELPDSVDLTYLDRTQDDIYPETDKTRYNVRYVMSLVYHAGTPDRRRECYAAEALWDFSGGDKLDWRLFRWEDTAPLQNASCPGGLFGGSLGRLRVLWGECPL